jgi:thiol-disulfide isomerase/thioredoxin
MVEAPASGDVESLVRDALAKSTAAKRRVLVYAGATWCEPCQRFHHAAEKGELDAAFPNLDILAFDMDRDSERLASAGYYSKLIPLFALPAADGTASGKQIEGGIKGDGAVGYITPRLKSLLAM